MQSAESQYLKYACFTTTMQDGRVCVRGFIEDSPVTSCFRSSSIILFGHHWWKYYNFTAADFVGLLATTWERLSWFRRRRNEVSCSAADIFQSTAVPGNDSGWRMVALGMRLLCSKIHPYATLECFKLCPIMFLVCPYYDHGACYSIIVLTRHYAPTSFLLIRFSYKYGRGL